jgi:hypothetical protein
VLDGRDVRSCPRRHDGIAWWEIAAAPLREKKPLGFERSRGADPARFSMDRRSACCAFNSHWGRWVKRRIHSRSGPAFRFGGPFGGPTDRRRSSARASSGGMRRSGTGRFPTASTRSLSRESRAGSMSTYRVRRVFVLGLASPVSRSICFHTWIFVCSNRGSRSDSFRRAASHSAPMKPPCGRCSRHEETG